MKRIFIALFLPIVAGAIHAQVHTTYLWHMDQPIYWGEKSQSNPNACQYVKESQDIKAAGGNKYSDGVSHPLNDLYEIFSKADRVAAYQWSPKTAIGSLSDLSNAGAQVSFSGSLMQNCNGLGQANQWGYSPTWYQGYRDARNWKTSGQHPKLDLIGFTKDHSFSPLISYRTLRKQIAAHRYLVNKYYGASPAYSKGYWPAECAFSIRIIRALVDEGIEWSIVANSHLARTLNDYPLTYGTSGCNIDPPNKADIVSSNGVNWWSGQIDGRGGAFAAPYCYTPHKARYIDPATATEYKITVVPMCDLLSYKDGYSQQGTADIDAHVAPYNNNPTHPPLVLLAHDGDNAWGGGASYYEEAVSNFSHAAAAKGYEPTTIQQYLTNHPVAENDIVHVEDGAWVNAENDWGHPLFINWLWPLFNNTTYRFNPDGWTEDARNWAVITAIENYVITAEDLAGTVRIEKCTEPDANATNAEKAWHFFFTTLNSGYMYYGKSLDMEVKQTVGGNHAISYAQAEINSRPGIDNTAPSIFNPQRFPYNPGGEGFGPLTGYQRKTMPSDFDIWTYVHDVSGISSVVLKYRTDKDGTNNPSTNHNEIYAGGTDVNAWTSVTMTRKATPKTNITNDPEINFFILPTAIADLCYAPITGLKDVLVDYYVEATDTKGNIRKSDIQHVYVGSGPVNVPVTGVTLSPTSATIGLGGTQQITATVLPNNATNKTVSWTTSNAAVATVNSNGLVTGISAGSATITVTTQDGGKTAVCNITVSSTPPPGFTVYFNKPTNWGTQTKIYYWNVAPSGAMPAVSWPGTDMTPVSGRTGWFKFFFPNTTSSNLIFNDNAGHQTPDLTRNKDGWYMNGVWYDTDPYIPVTSITLSPTSASLNVSGTQQLTATITPANASNKTINWSSSNNTVATVNTSGLVTAIAAGSAAILATTQDGNKTASCSVTVNTSIIPVTGVTVSPSSATLNVSGTLQLSATVLPSNATDKSVSWSSNNSAIATVSAGGLVTGVAPGNIIITVRTNDGGKTATCSITVSNNSVTYYRIKNRWQTSTYLYDNGAGQLRYGTNPVSSNYAYHWSIEDLSGFKQLKNRSTGKYVHIEHLYDYVESSAINTDWYSAQWTFESTGDGWLRLRNRWKTSDLIHIENLKGYAQHTGAQNNWWSAMWQLETTLNAMKLATAIEDNVDYKINIYPNPVTDKTLNIELPKDATLLFYNIDGKKIMTAYLRESGQIKLDLPKGLYFVIIKTDEETLNKKIVIQ